MSCSDDEYDYNPGGNNDNDNDNNPTNDSKNHPHNHDVATATQAADIGVNDLTLPPSKVTTAADVHHFYERDDEKEKMVCRECK